MYKVLRSITFKYIISFSLIVIMACFFLLGCSRENESDGRYKSISDIKGAKTIENPEVIFYVDNLEDYWQPEDYLNLFLKKTDDSICVGELSNPIVVEYKTSPFIWQRRTWAPRYNYDVELSWKISTFDIKVEDPVRNLDGIDVVKAVSVSFFYDGNLANTGGLEKIGDQYSEKSKGLFILQEITDEHRWSIDVDDYEIKLIDYADYYVVAYYYTDGVKFNFWDLADIYLDDFREMS